MAGPEQDQRRRPRTPQRGNHAAKATESGGPVVMDKHPTSDTSWWAIFTDPDGNTIGLYEGTTDTSG